MTAVVRTVGTRVMKVEDQPVRIREVGSRG